MATAYLVLDMQNDLVSPSGPASDTPLGKMAKLSGIVEKTAEAVSSARDAGVLIGFVRIGFSSDYRELSEQSSAMFLAARNYGLLQLGTPGADVVDRILTSEIDLDIVKHRVSPFYSTSLDLQLRAHRVSTIICSGTSTEWVVQAMAREATDRDYEVIVLEDCCPASSSEAHEASLTTLSRICRIAGSDEIKFRGGMS
jgi:nicotinamidase-related amidase